MVVVVLFWRGFGGCVLFYYYYICVNSRYNEFFFINCTDYIDKFNAFFIIIVYIYACNNNDKHSFKKIFGKN